MNMPPVEPSPHEQEVTESQASTSFVHQEVAGRASPLVLEIDTALWKSEPSCRMDNVQVQPPNDSVEGMALQIGVEELQISNTFSGKVQYMRNFTT